MSWHFGSTQATHETGDIDDDGTVTFEDFLLLAAAFGQAATE